MIILKEYEYGLYVRFMKLERVYPMFKKLMGAITALALTAGGASALSFEAAPGALFALPSNFNTDVTFGINATNNAVILAASGVGVGGAFNINSLQVTQKSKLTYTYLGSKAAYANLALGDGTVMFGNKTSAVGDTFTTGGTTGILDFAYCTNRGSGASDDCINNNGAVSGNSDGLNMATSYIFDFQGLPTALLFFGDNAGDQDRNDMIVAVQASAVPLPAGLLLLPAAFGLMAVRRKRK